MHANRYPLYVMLGVGAVAVALGLGINPGFLLILLVCPLMMFFMMRTMGGMNHDLDGNDQPRPVRDRRAKNPK